MYKIGEFARLINSTTKTVRYYDKEGLLKPDYIDNFTGYRYYSCYKISEFNRIIALKELGFTLAEIKASMNLKNNDDILQIIMDKKKTLFEEYENINNQISSLKKMEEDFMNLVSIYEDQSKYKNKMETDDKSIIFHFDEEDKFGIAYECSNKSDLYFATSFYLESINGFGLVCYDYEDTKEIFSLGEKAYIFKTDKDHISMYKDVDCKAVSIGLLVGIDVQLLDIHQILEPFADALSDDIIVMFSVVVDKKLNSKDIEISLINIK